MKTLETERLILKMYVPEDAEGLYEYAKNPNVGPNAGWAPHKDVAESEEIIRTIFMPSESWAIRLKDSGRLIGSIGLEPDKYRPDSNSREMGYSLAEDQWGKGLMTEAAERVLRFAFTEFGLEQVGICTSPANKRSQRVIEKCGFVYEGTIRRAFRVWTGVPRDSMVFSLLKEEWQEKRSEH
jgi:putative acetyltransferase